MAMISQDDFNNQSEAIQRIGGHMIRGSTYLKRPVVLTKRPKIDVVLPAQKTPTLTYDEPKQIWSPITDNASKNFLGKSDIKSDKPKRGFWLMAMAVVVFSIGVGVALVQLKTNTQVIAQTDKSNSNGANLAPSEVQPNPNSLENYQVAPDLPRFISVQSLLVKARVKRLGVNSQNQLEAPDNIYDAGWYENSAKPGDKSGAILMDGHVHGPTKSGVFAGLTKLKAGNSIQIERGDGQKYNFKVVKLQTYDANKVDMQAALTSIVPGKLGLNLITCTGPGIPDSHDYSKRLIVFAVER